MKNHHFLTGLLLVSLLTMLPAGRLAAQRSDLSFGFNMYATTPNSYGAHVWPRFGLNDNLKLGLNVGALFRGESSGRISENNTIIPAVVTFTYTPQTGKVRPFVGIGLGGIYVRTTVDLNGSTLFESDGGDFLLNMHAGLDIDLSERAFLQFTTGYDMLFDEFAGQSIVGAVVPVRLGVGFRL